MATGGSTNLVLHIPAMARAAGVILEPQDFADISQIVPLLAKVYPNGLADVNHFHAAGGLPYLIDQLLSAGLLHEDAMTIMGPGLHNFARQAVLTEGAVGYTPAPKQSLNDKILRPVNDPFQASGGLQNLTGNLGTAVVKISAVAEDKRLIEAPAAVFDSQDRREKSVPIWRLETRCDCRCSLPRPLSQRNARTAQPHPVPRNPTGPRA